MVDSFEFCSIHFSFIFDSLGGSQRGDKFLTGCPCTWWVELLSLLVCLSLHSPVPLTSSWSVVLPSPPCLISTGGIPVWLGVVGCWKGGGFCAWFGGF